MKPSDLSTSPAWEFALDEEGEENQDEATVRPLDIRNALDPADGMFIVAASFTLADGTLMAGYLTPGVQGDVSLGTIQPAVVTEGRQVSFWCGVVKPDSTQLADCYRVLGKQSHEVFPLSFSSQVKLVGGPVTGTVPGFLVLESFKSQKVSVVK